MSEPQWHRYVNLDTQEFIDMTDHGDIHDLSEPKRNRVAAKAIDVLIMPKNSGDETPGTYDKSEADYGNDVVGRWAGCRIAIVGDKEKTQYPFKGDMVQARHIFEDDDLQNITGIVADVLVDMDILE